MGEPVIQRSFAGGELAPALHARADLGKYVTGLRRCRNFIVRKEGGVANRAGFRFVDATKDALEGKRLMRYVADVAGGSVLIEIGAGYFRFFRDGAAVEVSGVPAYNGATAYVPGDLFEDGGVNYYVHTATTGTPAPDPGFYHALTGDILEIPTAYAADDRFHWNQSGNVITLTHRDHPPRELVYQSLTRWVLRNVVTGASLAAPGGGMGTVGAAGTLNYRYVVTSAAADTFEESNASAPIDVLLCDTPTPAAPNEITWTADPGAAEYYVYLDPYENGVYGFIGTAASNSFKDPGITPDFNTTPPLSVQKFNSSNNYPSTSASHQQRRFFASTNLEPDAVFGSRTGFPSNFGVSSPIQDDDAITFRVAGNNHHPVRFLVALKTGLVLMTDGGEWTVRGGDNRPLTPSNIDAEQETYVGVATDVRPVVVGNAILYVQARGRTVRELKFDQEVEGLAGKDLTIFATHLFKGKTIVAVDFQQEPDSIIWCVTSDGELLGLTYVPDQDVWGWHRHHTQQQAAAGVTFGEFEDVCVVPEVDEDAVYVIVKRTIDGDTVRYIERLEARDIREGFFNEDAFFVDSGLSYSGAPANSFTGLDHLEGQIVAVVGDGEVLFDGNPTSVNAELFTITGGELTLAADYGDVHIGLPITYAEIETLDLDVAGTSARDATKRVNSVTVLVERSSRSFRAGQDSSTLRQYEVQVYEPVQDETTDQLEISIDASWNRAGRVLIRQTDPLPLTILGVIPNVDLGG